MAIPSVTDTRASAPASMPVRTVAPAAATPGGPAPTAVPEPVKPAPPSPPPPPPPPAKGFNMDIEVGYHEATDTKTYNFVDPDTGSTVVQIPIEQVLDLVASILRQLEAEGKR